MTSFSYNTICLFNCNNRGIYIFGFALDDLVGVVMFGLVCWLIVKVVEIVAKVVLKVIEMMNFQQQSNSDASGGRICSGGIHRLYAGMTCPCEQEQIIIIGGYEENSNSNNAISMPLGGGPPSLQQSAALAVSGSFLVFLWYLVQKKRQQNCLPGPATLPLVGNLIQFINNKECIPQMFNRWTDKYGPIFVIRIGQVDAIVINTMDLIREAFSVRAMVFSDRPSSLPLIKKIYQGKGLAWQSGDQWKQLRHAARKALKCCGVGNQSLEERILFEVEKLIHELSIAEATGDAFDPSEFLHEAVTNILCSAIFGCRYKYGSKRMKSLVQMIRCNLSNCNIFHSANVFQFVSTKCPSEFAAVPSHKDGNKHCVLAPSNCKNDEDNRSVEEISCATENAKKILSFINDEIDRHREDFDPNNKRDFIDEYLASSLGGQCKKKPLHRQNIEATIMDLFTYGTDPTSVVLRWVILCLVEYPEVQQKCHDEIDQVIGCGRTATCEDEACLPYVRATLLETMRRFTAMPLGIPHLTKQDTLLCDFEIPAKTLVICNHHAIHMNAHYWTDPCKFCPERFLDDNSCGPELKISDAFIPYGIGPRSCAGSSLATNVLFLIFTNLLQRFEFAKACECDESPPSFHGTYDVTYSPLPYKIKIRVH